MQSTLLKGHCKQLSEARRETICAEWRREKLKISFGEEHLFRFSTRHVKGTSHWIRISVQKKPIKGRRSFREENYGTDVWTSGDITRWNWVRVKKFSVRVSTSNWMTFWAPCCGILSGEAFFQENINLSIFHHVKFSAAFLHIFHVQLNALIYFYCSRLTAADQMHPLKVGMHKKLQSVAE